MTRKITDAEYNKTVARNYIVFHPHTMSERIFIDRQLMHMTQTDYAKFLNIPAWVVGDWELERATPNHPYPKHLRRRALHIPMTIAFQVRRKRVNKTVEDMARLFGVSRTTMHRWEHLHGEWWNLARYWGFGFKC